MRVKINGVYTDVPDDVAGQGVDAISSWADTQKHTLPAPIAPDPAPAQIRTAPVPPAFSGRSDVQGSNSNWILPDEMGRIGSTAPLPTGPAPVAALAPASIAPVAPVTTEPLPAPLTAPISPVTSAPLPPIVGGAPPVSPDQASPPGGAPAMPKTVRINGVRVPIPPELAGDPDKISAWADEMAKPSNLPSSMTRQVFSPPAPQALYQDPVSNVLPPQPANDFKPPAPVPSVVPEALQRNPAFTPPVAQFEDPVSHVLPPLTKSGWVPPQAPAAPAGPPSGTPDTSSAGKDLQAGYLQALTGWDATRAAGMLKNRERLMGALQTFQQKEAEAKAQGYPAGFNFQPQIEHTQRLLADMEANINTAIGGVAKNTKRGEAFQMSPAAERFVQSNTWGDAFSNFLDDPYSVSRTLILRGLPSAAPGLAAGLGGGLVGGPAGAAAGMGIVGGASTIGTEAINQLKHFGADIADPASVKKVFSEHADEISSNLTKRALIIGGADAATGLVTSLLGKGLVGAPLADKLMRVAGGTAVNVAGGAGGEAGAEYATGQELHPGTIAGAGLSALPGTILEAIGAVRSGNLDGVSPKVRRFIEQARAADPNRVSPEVADFLRQANEIQSQRAGPKSADPFHPDNFYGPEGRPAPEAPPQQLALPAPGEQPAPQPAPAGQPPAQPAAPEPVQAAPPAPAASPSPSPGQGGAVPVRLADPTHEPAIRQAAESAGIDPDYMVKVAQIESSGKANAKNGDYQGLFQFGPAAWEQFGQGDPNNPQDAAAAMARMTRANQDALSQGLGRTPEPWELYLAHQQGAAGALRLLTAEPNTGAAAVLGRQQVIKNGGQATQTVGEYRQMWQQKYDQAGGQAGAPAVSGAPAQAGQAVGRPNYATVANMGDPKAPGWEQQNLTQIQAGGQTWQVNKKAAQGFQGLIDELAARGYPLKSGGGFNYRNIRGSKTTLSQHAFGNAIDINPEDNPLGSAANNLPPDIAEIAARHGLVWGGNFKGRKDPMHFEWAGGGDTGTAGTSPAPASAGEPLPSEPAEPIPPAETAVQPGPAASAGSAVDAPATTAEPAPLPGSVTSEQFPTHELATQAGDIRTKPIVIDMASITHSGQEGYDQALQPRDRTKIGSESQVNDIVAKFDPRLATEMALTPDRGAPIVNEQGQALSGNGRLQALEKIYQGRPEAAAAYTARLQKMGFDTTGMQRPALVHVAALTPEQTQTLVHGANKPTGLVMSAAENARADVRHITPDMAASLAKNPSPISNKTFMAGFMSKLSPEEAGPMLASDGKLTAQGIQRINNAVFAKAYGDSPVLERMSESADDNTKALSGAMREAAPGMLQLQAAIESGQVDKAFDPTADINQAVNHISRMRDEGINLSNYLAQVDAFNPIPDRV
jgi:hypothetical protein